jgi:hypothetical protein
MTKETHPPAEVKSCVGVNLWRPTGTPFTWAPKWAIQRLREALDAEGTVKSAYPVYHALCEIANEGGASFTTTQGFVGLKCGLDRHTVGERMRDFQLLGLLRYSVPELRGPMAITMALTPDEMPQQAPPVGSQTASVGRRGFLGHPPDPKIRKTLKNVKERSGKGLSERSGKPRAVTAPLPASPHADAGRAGGAKPTVQVGPHPCNVWEVPS